MTTSALPSAMVLRDQIANVIGKRLGGVYTSRHTLLDCADAVAALYARALSERDECNGCGKGPTVLCRFCVHKIRAEYEAQLREREREVAQAVQAERERWADQAENFPLEYARELAVPVLKRFVDALRAHPAEPAGEKG